MMPEPLDNAAIDRKLATDSDTLRISEEWVRKRIYGLEDQELRLLRDRYVEAHKEIISSLTIGYDDEGKPILSARGEVLTAIEAEINDLMDELEFRLGEDIETSWRQGYYGRAWSLDMTTDPDILATKDVLIPSEAIRALLVQDFISIGTLVDLERDQVISATRRSLTQSMIQGEGIQKAAKRLTKEIGVQSGQTRDFGGSMWRALTITRTEILRASNQGAVSIYEQNRDILSGWEWTATLDERVCIICAQLDGKVFLFDDTSGHSITLNKRGDTRTVRTPPPSGSHMNCILPGNYVDLPGELVAATKSFFVGRCVEILTGSGRKLTVTANHPILTGAGWKRAQDITEGDNVISAIGDQWEVSSVNPYDDNRPMVVEEVFETFMKTLGVSTTTVPASTEQFYGDGGNIHGNVDVVYTGSLLMSDGQPAINEPLAQQGFRSGDFDLRSFDSQRATLQSLDRQDLTLSAFMGCLNQMLSFFRGGVGPSDDHAFGFIAGTDAVFEQAPSQHGARKSEFFGKRIFTFASDIAINDNVEIGNAHPRTLANDVIVFEDTIDGFSINAELAGKFLDRFASDVTTDQVVSVRAFNFSGHVYDLQVEPYQLYICNGVVVKNCRCTAVPVLIDVALMDRVSDGPRQTYMEWAAINGLGTSDDGGLDDQRAADAHGANVTSSRGS